MPTKKAAKRLFLWASISIQPNMDQSQIPYLQDKSHHSQVLGGGSFLSDPANATQEMLSPIKHNAVIAKFLFFMPLLR